MSRVQQRHDKIMLTTIKKADELKKILTAPSPRPLISRRNSSAELLNSRI
jgi:hypothetical protein